MAWVRIHDGAMGNLKIVSLPDAAFRLWIRGLCYCQTNLTDGLIPFAAVKNMTSRRRDVEALATSLIPSRAPLWESIDGFGYKVHDYLDWNDSREVVENRQRLAKHRQAFLDDPDLRQILRARDKDRCRYCGRNVDWRDRKGSGGATYDHVDPKGPATPANLVVACRGCNSKKRDKLPEDAGMRLLDPEESRSDLGHNLDSESRWHLVTKPNPTKSKEEGESPSDSPRVTFDRFWAVYPKKVGKDAARRAWERRHPSGELTNTVLAALAWQIKQPQWTEQNRRFVPNPATWINAGRWQDEPPTEHPSPRWECPHDPPCSGGRNDCYVKQQIEQGKAL